MLVRTAVTQAQKAAVASLHGPKLLCHLVSTSTNVDLVQSCMHALLNLTTQSHCQDQAGRYGLDEFLQLSRSTMYPRMQHLASQILSNLQKHGANRTRLYKEELRLRRADVLEQPAVRDGACACVWCVCSRHATSLTAAARDLAMNRLRAKRWQPPRGLEVGPGTAQPSSPATRTRPSAATTLSRAGALLVIHGFGEDSCSTHAAYARFDDWVGNIGASNAAVMIKAARLKALKAGRCGAPEGYTFNPDTGD